MIKCGTVQSYTYSRCTSGVARAFLSQRHGEQRAVTASCTRLEARLSRQLWPYMSVTLIMLQAEALLIYSRKSSRNQESLPRVC